LLVRRTNKEANVEFGYRWTTNLQTQHSTLKL